MLAPIPHLIKHICLSLSWLQKCCFRHCVIGLGLRHGPTDVVICAIVCWKRVVAEQRLVESFFSRNSCSLSLSKILSFSVCTFVSCDSSFLLSISDSAVHTYSSTFFGIRHPMVVGIPFHGGGIVAVGIARACCAVSVNRGSFGCAVAFGRIFACAGDASVASFT